MRKAHNRQDWPSGSCCGLKETQKFGGFFYTVLLLYYPRWNWEIRDQLVTTCTFWTFWDLTGHLFFSFNKRYFLPSTLFQIVTVVTKVILSMAMLLQFKLVVQLLARTVWQKDSFEEVGRHRSKGREKQLFFSLNMKTESVWHTALASV